MRIKHKLVSIAIALVLVFFIGYGIELFNDSPVYGDFCSTDLYEIRDEGKCAEAGGMWNGAESVDRPVPEKGFCGETKECRDAYQDARVSNDQIVFIVAVLLGVVALVVGLYLKKETATNGLVGGGVLSILYGTIRYWEHADELLKFVILGLVLAFLVWIAYRRLK